MINDVTKVYGKAANEKEGNIHTHSKRISPATRIEKNKFVDFWGRTEHNIAVCRMESLACEVRE
jgi:hypothetical protein